MKFYAGIGARATPPNVLPYMTTMARALEAKGYVLRSGHAVGADQAFEAGISDPAMKQIFRAKGSNPSALALGIAAEIHPAWHMCSDYAKGCHARNVYQILGESLDAPVEFVICWTPGANKVGGTRTAIVLAEMHNIPVYNLASLEQQNQFENFLRKLDTNDMLDRERNYECGRES